MGLKSIEVQIGRGVPLDLGSSAARLLADYVGAPGERRMIPYWQAAEGNRGHISIEWPEGEEFYGGGSRYNLSAGGLSCDASGEVGRHIAFVDALASLLELQYVAISHKHRTTRDRTPLLMTAAQAELGIGPGIKRAQKRDLLGIAPVQWFGSAFVDAFGGDSVFEGLPDGWAEKVAPGLWKVFGVEDPEDPDAFEVERWSDRERAVIEALGPEFFFNVETGELATEFVEIPIATQYPVYLWDDAANELVIHEPDGSTRPANLSQPEGSDSAEEAGRVGPPSLVPVVVNRMVELMGDVFVDDDQLYLSLIHI